VISNCVIPMMPLIPDFFLVGTPKAGTTSIYRYLSQNKFVYVPKVKEPNYFCNVGPQKRNVIIINNSRDYFNLYKHAKENQLCGDFSVSYMHDPEAPLKIKKCRAKAKIIIIVRNPVRRAFSHWLMDQREGFNSKDFRTAFIEDFNCKGKRGFCYNSMYYDCSLYADAITRYQNEFENVLVLIYEELFDDFEQGINSIYAFLGIPNTSTFSAFKVNESGVVSNKIIRTIYQNTVIRGIVKKIVSNSLKEKIRGSIITKASEQITESDFNFIKKYFIDDVNRLRVLINNCNLWPDIK
jgi:hypothetical protein